MSDVSNYSIRPSQLPVVMDLVTAAKLSLFLWGPPGIGKSEIIAQWAKANGRNLIDIRLSQIEPTDLRGVPVPVDIETVDMDGVRKMTKRVQWSIPSVLPTDPDSTDVIFLDEFNSAMPICQAACYQLVLDRKLGEYVVPKNCVIIAAGNRDSDKAITFRMPTPIANRFVHVELATNFEDWQAHAVEAGTHPSVVGYLSQFTGQLFDFTPSSATRGFRTPRSWTFLSRLMYEFDAAAEKGVRVPHEIQHRLAMGCIGEGATTFMEHQRLADVLPPVEDILTGKVKELPMLKEAKHAALNYSLATSICYKLREEMKIAKEEMNNDPTNDKKWKAFLERLNTFVGFIYHSCSSEACILVARLGLKSFDLPLLNPAITNWVPLRTDYARYVVG